jgi:hypothetical protein
MIFWISAPLNANVLFFVGFFLNLIYFMTKLRVLVLSFHYFMDNSNTLGYPLLNKGEEKKPLKVWLARLFALTQFDFGCTIYSWMKTCWWLSKVRQEELPLHAHLHHVQSIQSCLLQCDFVLSKKTIKYLCMRTSIAWKGKMESISIPTFGSTIPYLNSRFNDDNQGFETSF